LAGAAARRRGGTACAGAGRGSRGTDAHRNAAQNRGFGGGGGGGAGGAVWMELRVT